MIHEKNGVLNEAGVWGRCNYPPHSQSRADHAGEPGKFDFYCSKRHRLAYLFGIFVKFSAVWGIFV